MLLIMNLFYVFHDHHLIDVQLNHLPERLRSLLAAVAVVVVAVAVVVVAAAEAAGLTFIDATNESRCDAGDGVRDGVDDETELTIR